MATTREIITEIFTVFISISQGHVKTVELNL